MRALLASIEEFYSFFKTLECFTFKVFREKACYMEKVDSRDTRFSSLKSDERERILNVLKGHVKMMNNAIGLLDW